MANEPREISTLPDIDSISDNTLFVVSKDGYARKVSEYQLSEYYKDIFLSGGVPYGKELTESWASLQTRIKAGDFTGIHIGDYKTITLDGGETVIMEVAGIDQYYKCGETQIGHHIDFISRNCLGDAKVFNSNKSNNGTEQEHNPWRASDLFKAMNDEFEGVYSKLPSDVKECIIEKYAQLESRYSSISQLNDDDGKEWVFAGKLWFPTEIEILGTPYRSDINMAHVSGGGCNCQYPIFQGNMKHIIKNNIISGNRASYWTISAGRNTSTRFCYINFRGYPDLVDSDNTRNVLLCFRIG